MLVRPSSYPLVVAAVLGGSLPPLAAQAADAPRSPLLSDARLAVPLAIEARDRPLGDLLKDLSKQLSVPLSATRNTSDDKVTLVARGEPAGRTLTALAVHLDFMWNTRGKGFELDQSLASRKREAALREAQELQAWTAIRRRMEGIARNSRLPVERIDQLLAQAGPQQAESEEAAALRDSRESLPRLAGGVYTRLNGQHFSALLAGRDVRFSTQAGTLDAGTADAIHRTAAERSSTRSVIRVDAAAGGGAAAPRPNLPVADDENAPPSGAEVIIRLSQSLPPLSRRVTAGARPQRAMRLNFNFRSIAGDRSSRRIIPMAWSPAVQNRPEQKIEAAEPQDPALDRVVQLELPRIEAQQGGVPALVLPGTSGALAQTGTVPLSLVAAALSKAAELPVLSDSFVRERVRPASLTARQPLRQILRTLVAESGLAWNLTEGRLTFRSLQYVTDRPQEVPQRILDPWKKGVLEAGATSLDALSQLAVVLTDPQALGMQDYWPYYMENPAGKTPEAPPGVYDHRQHLRFWATLAAPQRARLAAGEILPATGMTDGQRAAFATAVTSPNESPITQGDDLGIPPTIQDVARGGFRLRREASQRSVLGGIGADGRQSFVVALSSGGGAGGLAGGARPMITLPDGSQLNPDLAQVTKLDAFIFTYMLAGDPTPAKIVSLSFPIPK